MLNNTNNDEVVKLKRRNFMLFKALKEKEELLKAYKRIDALEEEVSGDLLFAKKTAEESQKYFESLNGDDGPIITDVQRVIIRYNPKRKYIRFYFKDSDGDVQIKKINADKTNLRAFTDYLSLYYKFEQGGVYDSDSDDPLDNMDSDDDEEMEDLD